MLDPKVAVLQAPTNLVLVVREARSAPSFLPLIGMEPHESQDSSALEGLAGLSHERVGKIEVGRDHVGMDAKLARDDIGEIDLLGVRDRELDVGETGCRRTPPRLVDQAGLTIDADHAPTMRSQRQRQPPRPRTDIEY